jgi:hypothetical protein
VGDRVVPFMTGGISTVDPFLPALAQARRSGAANSDHVLTLDKIELCVRITVYKWIAEPTYLSQHF